GLPRAPRSAAQAELRDRGSLFLARVAPVTSEEEARAALREFAREFADATHHCWALRLADSGAERSSDAGEPAGTAGEPILRQLRRAGVANAVVLVARWFGGTKLGRGGLVRAYGAAARAALDAADLAPLVLRRLLRVRVAPQRAGAVKRLLRPGVE